MDLVSGVKEKAVLGIRDIRSGDYDGKTVHMNGAVHTIRQMGEISFIVLRKAEGLVQCVYEGRKSGFDIRELKEESTDNTISEAVDDLKSDLSDEYREKIRGLSRGTTKDRKVASWESKVRKKLGDYLVDSWEIEEFIYDVEHGTYY